VEKDPSTSDIHCIKMKTPLVLKTDWDKLGSVIGFRFFEQLGEHPDEEETHDLSAGI